MKKIEINVKKQISGGSFYAIALGIGILVSTISSLISTGVSVATGNKQSASGIKRGNAYIRLSPVPSRSALCLFL